MKPLIVSFAGNHCGFRLHFFIKSQKKDCQSWKHQKKHFDLQQDVGPAGLHKVIR